MLPQFGLTEFLLIATVALIVVGPKDLPLMMRKLGQFVAKGKAMAREFQSAFDDIAKQAELDELRKEIEDLRRENTLTQAVDDLRKTEADINRQVMMQNPMPASEGKSGPGAIPDKTDEPAALEETPQAAKPEPQKETVPEEEPAPKATKS